MDSAAQQPNISSSNPLMVGALLLSVGAGAYFLKSKETERAERKARRAVRRQKRLEKMQAQAERDAANPIVTLYFNDKDELVEARQARHEIKTEGVKYQKVTVNFGAEEDVTKVPIPKHAVSSKGKTENAKIFLQRYKDQKEIQQRHKELPNRLDLSDISGASDDDTPIVKESSFASR